MGKSSSVETEGPKSAELLAGLTEMGDRWGVPGRQQQAVTDAERHLEWQESLPEVELGKYPSLDQQIARWRHRIADGQAAIDLGTALFEAGRAYRKPDLQELIPDMPAVLLERSANELQETMNSEIAALLQRAADIFDSAPHSLPGYSITHNVVDYASPRAELSETERDVIDVMVEGAVWSLVAKARQIETLAEMERLDLDVGGCDVDFHAGWWTGHRGLGRHPEREELERVWDRLKRLQGGTKLQLRQLANAEAAVLIQCGRVNEAFEYGLDRYHRTIRFLDGWDERPELNKANRQAIAELLLTAHEAIRAHQDREADQRRDKIAELKAVVAA